MYYYNVILSDIIHRYGLQSSYHTRRQPTQYGVVYTATVSVNNQIFRSTEHDEVKAQEQAASNAIAGLERQGFRRRHFKTDLNNLARRYNMIVRYENSHEGRPHRRAYKSIVTINGTPDGSPGKASRETHAEELAAKTVVERLEESGYRLP